MKKVILVDDLKPLVEDLTVTINRIPFVEVIATAHSGKDAIHLGESLDYDLMLLDIEMENTSSGIQAAREIIQKKSDARIVFLTAHDNKDTILSAMATGAVDYIVKGLSGEQFIIKIQKILEGDSELNNHIQTLLLTEYKRLRNSETKIIETMNKIKKLTNAETELVGYLIMGKSQKQIAQIRHVELVTIKTQISSILKKFEVKKSKEIVKLIQELELKNLFLK